VSSIGQLDDFTDVDEKSFTDKKISSTFKKMDYTNSPLLSGFIGKKRFQTNSSHKHELMPQKDDIIGHANNEEIEILFEHPSSCDLFPAEEQMKICYAPPGKLGVAIDTVGGFPVVYKVKNGSPLEGILSHLDRIIAIDDIKTVDMSAAQVTKLMISRMGKNRKINFIPNGYAYDQDYL